MTKNKEYTNGEVTIVWKPDLCIHSAICVNGLPDVFKPKSRPWINPEAATTQQLIGQVKECPSGALSFYMNADKNSGGNSDLENEPQYTVVEIMKDGPLLVSGDVTVKRPDGSTEQKKKVTAFCRCGFSDNKPYCDGTHKKENFKG